MLISGSKMRISVAASRRAKQKIPSRGDAHGVLPMPFVGTPVRPTVGGKHQPCSPKSGIRDVVTCYRAKLRGEEHTTLLPLTISTSRHAWRTFQAFSMAKFASQRAREHKHKYGLQIRWHMTFPGGNMDIEMDFRTHRPMVRHTVRYGAASEKRAG